jgi:hypothetical protein
LGVFTTASFPAHGISTADLELAHRFWDDRLAGVGAFFGAAVWLNALLTGIGLVVLLFLIREHK